jgi:hypothetical protein
MTSNKVIENEIIDYSDVIYIEDDSDVECCMNEDMYDIAGDDDLIGYDSDCDEEIPEENDENNIQDFTEPFYDSDDDKDQTGYKLGLQYCEQNK